MDDQKLNLRVNYFSIIALSFIFIGVLFVSIKGINNPNFFYQLSFNWIEGVSLLIFIFTIISGLKSFNWFVVFLVFNLIALPASVDNFFPSVLISAQTDSKLVYFPILTHIDIYILIGLFRYWNKQYLREIRFSRLGAIVFYLFACLLIVSMSANILRNSSLTDVGLIASHSYHLRYFLLLGLLCKNTPILKYRNELFYGILVSIAFLIFESTVTSFYFNRSRLVSGTLGNNVFAALLAATAIYLMYLIRIKAISRKHLILVIIMAVAMFFAKTRSAIFLFSGFLLIEIVMYTINMFRQNNMRKSIYLFVLFLLVLGATIFSFSQTERLSVDNFKIEKIDLTKTELKDIVVFEENDFNASLSMRLGHFQTSLNMIRDHPIFGIGPGRWNKYKTQYGSRNTQTMDSHNDFLALASQYGLLTGTFFCMILYIAPFLLRRLNRQESFQTKDPLNYLCIISFIMMLAGISNAVLFKHQIFAFLALILMTYTFRTKEENPIQK